MASNMAKSNRMMRRMDSKKSHSWWWDSHINPKNSKWLQENLEEMDEHIKRMLKLIEEDADSFAKKAEMYYQKRPELIRLVEDFYRMYRSLAERYDNVTGELRKNIPSDIQSQGSGVSGLSDVGSEPPSTMPSPDRRGAGRNKSGPRAAGFEFFLGNSGGSGSDMHNNNDSKEGDENESSSLDSGSESDDSSVNNFNNYSGNDEDHIALRSKIMELEVELREVKDKLKTQDEEISEKITGERNFEVDAKIAMYEEELRVAKEEISRLTIELQKNENLGNPTDDSMGEFQENINGKIETLEEELRTQEKFRVSEERFASLSEELTSKGSTIQDLQEKLKSAQEEASMWKNKLEKEKREVAKLQERVARYKTNLADRDQEIRGLKEAMSNANKSLSEENEHLQAEITRISKERTYLADNLKELDLRCQSLEDDVRRAKAGKTEVEDVFKAQIEQLKADLAEKTESSEELKKTLDELQIKYETEKDNLNNIIDEMSKHLHELHMEHVGLIAGAEGARKLVGELRGRIRELEREVKRKQEMILEGAEEKREAIRQLCFSLEHYRNGYHKLREAVMGNNKRMPVMAS